MYAVGFDPSTCLNIMPYNVDLRTVINNDACLATDGVFLAGHEVAPFADDLGSDRSH